MSETTEIWSDDWEEYGGLFYVLAAGLTAEQAAERLRSCLAGDAGDFDSGALDVCLVDGPQPCVETVHDCHYETLGTTGLCEDPDCRHGHEELVYVFEVGERAVQ